MTAGGDGFAIVVSANAKRGGRRVAAQIARALPGANVRLTRTAREVDAWLASLPPATRCVLAAGGDGTAIALVNALHRVHSELPRMGVLPLGTGNAWAHVTGAPKLHVCLKRLEAASRGNGTSMPQALAASRESSGPSRTLPVRRFGLIECEGMLTHFAGAGWDARILDDYRVQVSQSKGPSKLLSKSVYGYVAACLFRTVPKALLNARPHVIIENLADEAWTITADRKLLKLAGVGRGAVLWDGPASVAGCATCPELGYGFRAYPFAERFIGMMNVRVYDEHTLAAVANIPALWRGQHPLRGMHDWFSTAVRMTFSRPVPLQIGGDAIGTRQSVEYRIFDREIELLDWRGM